MPLIQDYITADDLKQSGELKGTSYADRDIARAIPAACRAIDALCHRRFGQDETEVSRLYTAATDSFCWISDVSLKADDLTDDSPLTVVVVDRLGNGSYSESWDEGVDYVLEPLNATLESKPYESIRALRACFPRHVGAIRVTARYGWTTVPAEVVEAAVLLANKLIVRVRQAPFGIVMAGADVGVAMRIAKSDPDVAMLLEELTREAIL